MSGAVNSGQDGRDTLDLSESDASAVPDPAAATAAEESPEKLPMNTWVTLGLFAAFVVLFGTCASTFMFN